MSPVQTLEAVRVQADTKTLEQWSTDSDQNPPRLPGHVHISLIATRMWAESFWKYSFFVSAVFCRPGVTLYQQLRGNVSVVNHHASSGCTHCDYCSLFLIVFQNTRQVCAECCCQPPEGEKKFGLRSLSRVNIVVPSSGTSQEVLQLALSTFGQSVPCLLRRHHYGRLAPHGTKT